MASFASRSTDRKPGKLVKYGKSSRSTYNTKHIDTFLDDDDDDVPEAPRPAARTAPTLLRQREHGVKETTAAQRLKVKVDEQKKRNEPSKSKDTFDIPSSDDEYTSQVRRPSPPKLKAQRPLIEDTRNKELASWEKPKVTNMTLQPKNRTVSKTVGSEGLNLRLNGNTTSPAKPTSSPQKGFAESNSPKKTGSLPKSAAPQSVDESKPLSAVAKLAARRKLAAKNSPPGTTAIDKTTSAVSKRTITDTEESGLVARKRSRKNDDAKDNGATVDSSDTATKASEVMVEHDHAGTAEKDVYSLPESSADDSIPSEPTVKGKKGIIRRKRRPLPSSSARSTPPKGSPARVAAILPTDADNTEAPSRSPSASLSRPGTPHKSAKDVQCPHTMTPRTNNNSSSPQTAIRDHQSVTPRRLQLWDQLLPDEIAAPSPSALPLQDLRITSTKKSIASSLSGSKNSVKHSVKSSANPRKRLRLVDRLKASVESSSDEEPSEVSDAEMKDSSSEATSSAVSSQKPGISTDNSTLSAPSQSQLTVTNDGGPKITYASARSYIQEDTLDDIMMDLQSITPQRAPAAARRTGQTKPASKKSVFDFDDSDNESGPVRLRTIHELRAAGRNMSFMQDTEALLDDIANHAVSARSRRRSAFIEIATKLIDKGYAGRFVDQGFEDRLIVECSATPDSIADPVLAAAICLLLGSEPPQHTLTCLQEHNTVSWLIRMLPQDSGIEKLAKDRRNNMSKMAQASIIEFFKLLGAQESLWGEFHNITLTPRSVALKTLELLIGRLRRLGDRSELFPASDFNLVVRNLEGDDAFDTSLSISVLERVSTSAQAISWPLTILEQFAPALPKLGFIEGMPQHTTFLALRLALNLTNDNAENCNVLAQPDTVDYLLNAIESGFTKLETDSIGEQRHLKLDLLVLGLGIMINLAEHSEQSRNVTIRDRPKNTLGSILALFQRGQKAALDAESEEDTTTNVAFGYLAIMLANICLNTATRQFVRTKLPGENLRMLVEAVREFVRHHERVDEEGDHNEEGRDVWGNFTAKLKVLQNRLEAVDRSD